MNVIEFPGSAPGAAAEWRERELRSVLEVCAGALGRGEASDWEVGLTEAGDPQFYLLGPAPECECILSITRLGHSYVLEDGRGQLLLEQSSMAMLAEQARAHLTRQKTAIVARLTVLWCAVREAFEEKLEPMLAEPAEVICHFAPQLAAMA